MNSYIKNNFFALAICIIWLFPVTYFGYWTAPVGIDVFKMLRYPVVGAAFIALTLGAMNGINWRLLIFLFIALIASVNSNDMLYSFAKFAGFAVIVGLFSPLIRSEKGRAIREKLWNNLCWSAVAVVLISLFWKAASLPAPVLYRKEGFAGITSHAMLFGPIAGIAAIFLLSKALTEKNHRIMILASLCYLTVFSSLSRVAIAATTIGMFVVFMLSMHKGRGLSAMRLLLPIVLILALLTVYLPADKMPLGFGKSNVIALKGLENSRERLWKARMEEFRENPLLGLGIGMSEGSGRFARRDEDRFGGTVEPGSAYLVVLSMTGFAGAIFLIFAILTELNKLRRFWQSIPPSRKYELAGIGSLLFVHAGAEGWIYSPGGVLCLFFWLWLGLVGDSVDRAVYGFK